MALSQPGFEYSVEAGSDLSSDQFKFVKIAADGQIDVVTSEGSVTDGVLQDAPAAAGRPGRVMKSGITKVLAGGTLAVGDRVKSSSSGTAVAAKGGEPSCGVCLSAAAATEIAHVLLDDVADSGVRVKRGTITAAQIQTLNATPVEVLSAPGAGLWIEVESVHFMLDFGTAAYDGVGAGEDLVLKYTDASGQILIDTVDAAGFLDASADAHALATGIMVDPLAPAANAAVVAHILVGEIYAAAGDSPIHYEIRYRVRTLDISA